MGRPHKELDEDLIYGMARIGCTVQEIATCFRVSRQTIHNNYQDVIDEGYSEMKESVRRAQLKLALAGNATMLIWLGKQSLGQKDSPVDNTSPVKKVKLEEV